MLLYLNEYYLVYNILKINLLDNIFSDKTINKEDLFNKFKKLLSEQKESFEKIENSDNIIVDSKKEMLNYLNNIIDNDIISESNKKKTPQQTLAMANEYIKSDLQQYKDSLITSKSKQIESFTTMNDSDISSNYIKETLNVGESINDNKNGTHTYSDEKSQNGGQFGNTIGYNLVESNNYLL